MEEELELNLDVDPNPAQERITKLSTKVRDTSKERDEAKAAAEASEAKAAGLQKEVEFLTSFSNVATKYQGASEHTEDIKAKVLSGYTIEDATVSVLNSAGKLIPQAPVQAPQGPAAGGSAATAIPQEGSRETGDMKSDELRSALEEAMNNGELSKVFRP